MWLNPLSANKTSVAIGCIVKETKPGKILVEDDEGKVSVARLPRDSGPTPTPSLQGPEPHSSSGAAPQHQGFQSPSGGNLPDRTDHSGVLSW